MGRGGFVQTDLDAERVIPHRHAVAEQRIAPPFVDRDRPDDVPTGQRGNLVARRGCQHSVHRDSHLGEHQ